MRSFISKYDWEEESKSIANSPVVEKKAKKKKQAKAKRKDRVSGRR